MTFYLPYLPNTTISENITPMMLPVTSLSSCTDIQFYITSLVYDMMTQYSPFTDITDVSLFSRFCVQINIGTTPVKKKSLLCVDHVLNKNRVKSLFSFSSHKLIDILIGIIYSGQDRDTVPKFRDEEFDSILARCITTLDKNELFSTRLKSTLKQAAVWIIKHSRSKSLKCLVVQQMTTFSDLTQLIPYMNDDHISKTLISQFQTFFISECESQKRMITIDDQDVTSQDEVMDLNADYEEPVAKRRKIDFESKQTHITNSQSMDDHFDLPKSCEDILTEFNNRSNQIQQQSKNDDSHFTELRVMLQSCHKVIVSRRDKISSNCLASLSTALVSNLNVHNTKMICKLLKHIQMSLVFFHQSVLESLYKFCKNSQTVIMLSYFPHSFKYKDRLNDINVKLLDKDESTRIQALSAVHQMVQSQGFDPLQYFLPQLRKMIVNQSPAVLAKLSTMIGQLYTLVIKKQTENVPANLFCEIIQQVLSITTNNNMYREARLQIIDSISQIVPNLAYVNLNKSMLEICLQLLFDTDLSVRHKFTQQAFDCFIENEAQPCCVVFGVDKSKVHSHIYNYIKSRNLENQSNPNFQALGRLASQCSDQVLVDILFYFMNLLEGSDNAYNMNVMATAYDQIRFIARRKGIDTPMLFDHHQQELYDWIYDRLVQRHGLIQAVAESVFDTTQDLFLEKALPHVLPKLIRHQEKDKIKALAVNLKSDVKSLVICHSDTILVYLFMHNCMHNHHYMEYMVHELCGVTSNDFCEMMLKLATLTTKLILEMSTNDQIKFNRVLSAMKYRAKWISDKNELCKEYTYKTLLNEHFLGVVDTIISNIKQKDHSIKDKIGYMNCFNNLLKLMGDSLRCYTKIMATLNDIMEDDELRDLACDTWLTFVTVADPGLKVHMGQISVILLKYVNSNCSDKIATIFHTIVIDKADIFSDSFKDIPYIPNTPQLSKVSQVVSKHIGSMSLNSQIDRMLKMTSHESSIVVVMCLTQLKDLLINKQQEFRDKVMHNEQTLNHLMARLLAGCNDANSDIRLICVQCLGVVGAVDPGTLRVETKFDSREMLTDVELVTTLLSDYCIKALKDVKDHDHVSYVVQELLYYCYRVTVSPSTETYINVDDSQQTTNTNASNANQKRQVLSLDMVKDMSWWNRFNAQQKEIITPYLSSALVAYERKQAQSKPRVRKAPFYQPGTSFDKWLRIWLSELSKRSSGTRKLIFSFSRMLANQSPASGMFLLPYLVQNVIMNGGQKEIDEVKEEIIAVMSQMDSEGSEHAQTIFSLLELLKKWVDKSLRSIDELQQQQQEVANVKNNKSRLKKTNSNTNTSNANQQSTAYLLHAERFKNIETLIDQIPKKLLSESAMINRAYTRAYKYYEEYLRVQYPYKACKKPQYQSSEIAYIQKIYSYLDEPDGLSGIATLRTQTSLQEQILDDESSGRWIEAMHCHEQALQKEPDNVQHQLSLIKCFRNLGHLQTMLRNIDGALLRLHDHSGSGSSSDQDAGDKASNNPWIFKLATYAVQSAWRLSQWDLVQEFLGRADQTDIEVGIAKALLAYREQDKQTFDAHIMDTRKILIGSLSAASMESYSRSYPYVISAQMLSELEQSYTLWERNDQDKLKFVGDMEDSLKLTVESLNARETLLSLRRVIYEIHGMNDEVGRCWLSSAKVARRMGYYQTASSAILQARNNMPKNFYIEQAKLLWDQGNIPHAINAVESAYPDCKDSYIKAKMMLMAVRWNEETRHKASDQVIQQYNAVIELQKEWEMGYFHLAKYHDYLFTEKMNQIDKQDKGLENNKSAAESSKRYLEHYENGLPQVIDNYGASLKYGCKNLYVALPRMLTVWFQAGSELTPSSNKEPKTKVEQMNKVIAKLNRIMRELGDTLAPFVWYVALSQITSRIVHENESVRNIVKQLVDIVLTKYPAQSMWTMCYLCNHSSKNRREHALDLLNQVARREQDVNVYKAATERLFTPLLLLCKKDPKIKVKELYLNSLKYMADVLKDPPKAMVPLQRSFNITLPKSTIQGVLDVDYDAFPSDSTTMVRFMPTAVVMSSLQAPKKISIQASDLNTYSFLAKEDDLRKDNRMMEFSTMLNRLLKKTPDTRRRKLYIRTFAAIPLKEDVGLVEWVDNTVVYRTAVEIGHKALNKVMADHKVASAIYKQNSDSQDARSTDVRHFENFVLQHYPPTFHAWFSHTFAEPTKWFESRLNYTRTLAVMSMVGYIVGLGDRHSENILLDCSNGDVVHVDLSMLFERGRTLNIPERVPFRLTHNMVDAMGVTGTEGVFRSVCESALGVLRNNKDALLNVLESFVHDPLVEWNKEKKSNANSSKSSRLTTSDSSTQTMKLIGSKLMGQMGDGLLPLSVKGQVDALISEATSNENLSGMYIWWMPWV
ncbi:serine/threonine-protein kinase ATR [Acrasis kona]|uniref:Serine/threonine-protein kinase ATR n=1 Tax=Acrasis kona TaxID=1008807 RepID=A0AAW2ZMC4_9EUKA